MESSIMTARALPDADDAAVADLVAELVRRTPRTPLDDVLLDVNVSGVRCVLVRAAAAAEEPPLLSPREREIARLVAAGHGNKTIAAVLDISTWTVGTHLRRIFGKLGVTSRAAMVSKLKPL
jgi:DNA-binding CsgD family transcriptional regulator